MVVMVKYDGLQSISDTHTRTLLGHKTSFLWVENIMWIFGAKKLTADRCAELQNHSIARINGNLGHPNTIQLCGCVSFLVVAGNKRVGEGSDRRAS